MKTVFKDMITGELALMQERGFIDFFDDNGEVYDGALLVQGTPSELRYIPHGQVKDVKEFLEYKKQAELKQ